MTTWNRTSPGKSRTSSRRSASWSTIRRQRLREIGGNAWLTEAPHLVFFLHDEIVVHTPASMTEEVVEAVNAAAAEAGRLLFGNIPVEFPLTVAVVESYADAK